MARRIGLKPLAQLCRRAGVSLAAGIDARRFWQSEVQRAGGYRRRAISVIHQEVAAGSSMAEALAAVGDFFPPTARELVTVGEESGQLAEVFRRLAEHYERLLQLRRVFLAGLVRPALQLAAAAAIVGLLILLMGVLAPAQGEAIDMLGLGLTGERGLVIYLLFLSGIAAVIAGLIVACQRGWAVGRVLGWLAVRLPILGHYLKLLALARFCWSLSITLGTGMDVRRAVKLGLRGSQYGPLLARQQKIDARLVAGSDIHAALSEARAVLPNELLDAVAVGEESGSLSESLELLSRQYEEKAAAAAEPLTVVATLIIWGMVALVIIAVIMRLMMFYVGTINEALP